MLDGFTQHLPCRASGRRVVSVGHVQVVYSRALASGNLPKKLADSNRLRKDIGRTDVSGLANRISSYIYIECEFDINHGSVARQGQ